MGYMSIKNLYADQTIRLFRDCYILEKLHGSSSNLTFKRKSSDLSTPRACAESFLLSKPSSITADEFAELISSSDKDPNQLSAAEMGFFTDLIKKKYPKTAYSEVIKSFHAMYSSFLVWRNQFAGWDVRLFSGGAKFDEFAKLFDIPELARLMNEHKFDEMTIYGEAYGGKMQGMSKVYGPKLKFCAFDVKIGDRWLEVPIAEEIVKKLGLEFVSYQVISTDLECLDAARDAYSVQSKRNGVEGDHYMEGVVLRPLIELLTKHGERIITKHKRPEFRETKTQREVSSEKQMVLVEAEAVAIEWVTEMRLHHVLDKIAANLGGGVDDLNTEHIPVVIKAMTEDISREGAGEIEWSKEVTKSISTATVNIFKKLVMGRLV